MSNSCKITRILEGSSEKNYYLIKYIKMELEKKGLNPKISLVISDQEIIDLFANPSRIPETLSTEEEVKKDEKSTIKWGFTFPTLWGNSDEISESKKNGFTTLSPIDTIFSHRDEDNKVMNKLIPDNPKSITVPYLNFKERFDVLFNLSNKKSGGGKSAPNYKNERVEIMIEV
jgi:hypothetical protein